MMHTLQTKMQLFDVIGQVAMILIPLCCSAFQPEAYYLILFTLGGWQLLSHVCHFFTESQYWQHAARRKYAISLLVLFIAGVLSLVGGVVFIFYLMLLVLAGAVLGMFYLWISVSELSTLRKLDTPELSQRSSGIE